MYCYIVALLLLVSCALYVRILFHTYHNIHITCIITYILFYVVLHIGLAAMSLVWLVCCVAGMFEYYFICITMYAWNMYRNISIFLYVLLRIGLTAMSPSRVAGIFLYYFICNVIPKKDCNIMHTYYCVHVH